MYFNGLKYVVLVLCGVANPETVFVPSVFEDFAGSAAIQLVQSEDGSNFAPGWTLELLVGPGDLPAAPLTLRRVGLRTQETGHTRIESIRASITLSTTRTNRLKPSPIDNTGANPTTFFVEGWWGVLPGAVSAPVLFFDLGAGYRFDPEETGSLHVRIDLDTDATIALETAPSKLPVFLTRYGDSASVLHNETPIISLSLDNRAAIDTKPAQIATTSKRSSQRAKRRNTSGAYRAKQVSASDSNLARLAAETKNLRKRIRHLERRNDALESQLGLAIQTNAKLASVVADGPAPSEPSAEVKTADVRAQSVPKTSAKTHHEPTTATFDLVQSTNFTTAGVATQNGASLARWSGGAELPLEMRRRRIAPYDLLGEDVTNPEVTRP